jgi:hypothetical protein
MFMVGHPCVTKMENPVNSSIDCGGIHAKTSIRVSRRRQKVKPYFLPVQSAKKNRQSLPFFEEKATQHQGRANLLLFFSWLEGEATSLQTQTYLSKSSGYFLTLPK